MKINWTEIYKKHKGLWVALDKDETTILSSSKSLERALSDAKKKGYKDPIVTKVPTDLISYIG